MKELVTFRKYLNEGVINEIEKEDIDNMDDLEDNDIWQSAVYETTDESVEGTTTALAKEMGYDSYQDYIEKVGDESDEYKEEFMPIVIDNAEIDVEVVDAKLKEFFEYCNVTFEVDLRKKLYNDAKDQISDYY